MSIDIRESASIEVFFFLEEMISVLGGDTFTVSSFLPSCQ